MHVIIFVNLFMFHIWLDLSTGSLSDPMLCIEWAMGARAVVPKKKIGRDRVSGTNENVKEFFGVLVCSWRGSHGCQPVLEREYFTRHIMIDFRWMQRYTAEHHSTHWIKPPHKARETQHIPIRTVSFAHFIHSCCTAWYGALLVAQIRNRK